MRQFNNILCVMSGVESDQATLARAVSLAENNQGRLTVASVIPHIADSLRGARGASGGMDLETAIAHERRQSLESLAAPYRQRVSIELAVMVGTGFLDVIRAVLRQRIDLVMKAAENPSFVTRIFGSDDMHLLRKCPCPVWLTRPGEKSNYTGILAAVDPTGGGAEGTKAGLNQQILDLASSLALSDFAELHIVHAWDAPGEATIRAWSDQPDAAGMEFVEGERARHQHALDRLGARLREDLGAEAFDYLAPRFHLRRGPPSEVIPQVARQMDVDLTVMGTVARTGIAGLLIGNTAETILEQLSCSVLALKPEGFVSPITP